MRWFGQFVVLVVFASSVLAQSAPTDFASDRGVVVQPVVHAASLRTPVAESLPVPAAKADVLPIDLPTALRIANASSPTIALAQARVREALARVDQADALWLPNLSAGGIYLRHDGIDQNRGGDLLTVTRSSLFEGGGAALRLDTAEAFYQPLVARRLVDAAAAAARANTNNALFDVVSAYYDLVHAHAQVEINADILAKAEQILKAAKSGEKQGLIKTAADVNRAETEVSQRRVDRLNLEAQVEIASARLVKLLVLDPKVTLVPADSAVAPIDLIADTATEKLIEQALRNRPELAAAAFRIDAAEIRSRQAWYGPLFPRVQVEYLGGGFGGGTNSTITNPAGRNDLSTQIFWELRGLGFGNLADARARDAQKDQATILAVAARAQVASEVVESAKTVTARKNGLQDARRATTEAQEMFRKLSATSFGMIGGKGQFDALEPLIAVQQLNQARLQFLSATVEYNRAQFRLLTSVGTPADTPIKPTGP